MTEYVVLRSQTEPYPTPEQPEQVAVKFFPIRHANGALRTLWAETEEQALVDAKILYPYLKLFLAVEEKTQHARTTEYLRARHTGRATPTPATGFQPRGQGKRSSTKNSNPERRTGTVG